MSDESKSAAIDQMITALNGSAHAPQAQPTPSPSLRYDSATGVVEYLDGEPQPGAPAPRIPDNGQNVHAQVAAIDGEIAALDAKLEAHTFDPSTGNKVYTLTGREREVMQAARAIKEQTKAFYAEQGRRLEEQRRADLEALQAAQNEKLAKAAFVNGDPTRARLLDEELKRAEAAAVAAAIVRGRQAQRGS